MTEKTNASAGKAKATATPVEQIYAAFAEHAELIFKASTDAARKTYDTAASVTREPAAVAMNGRASMKEYDDAVAFGRDNIDAAAEAGTIAMRGLQDVGKELAELVQKSAEEVPAAVKAIASCKTVKEAAELQVDLAKANFEDMVNSAVKFQQLGFKLATAAFEPINKRFAVAVSKYGKPFVA